MYLTYTSNMLHTMVRGQTFNSSLSEDIGTFTSIHGQAFNRSLSEDIGTFTSIQC